MKIRLYAKKNKRTILYFNAHFDICTFLNNFKNKNFVIRFLTFLVFTGTFFVGCWGICVNSNYYRNTIRPYIECIPENSIEIETGKIKYEYTAKNKGKTPAYKVKCYSVIEKCDTFPENLIIKKIKEDTTPPKSIIFQDSKVASNLKVVDYKNKDSTPMIKDTIIQRITSKIDTFFLSFYLEYLDVNNYPYYFRQHLMMKPSENFKETGDCRWYQIDVSEKPIIIKTKRQK